MSLIEVDQEVWDKLQEAAKPLGVTSNGVIRDLLGIEKRSVPVRKNASKSATYSNSSNLTNKNIQDELIPHIVRVLYESGGSATKSFVENKIFDLFRDEFEKPYYNVTLSHGVPRWKKNIAWAKDRAKSLNEFIKRPEESGRGIWELTDKGKDYYENTLR